MVRGINYSVRTFIPTPVVGISIKEINGKRGAVTDGTIHG